LHQLHYSPLILWYLPLILHFCLQKENLICKNIEGGKVYNVDSDLGLNKIQAGSNNIDNSNSAPDDATDNDDDLLAQLQLSLDFLIQIHSTMEDFQVQMRNGKDQQKWLADCQNLALKEFRQLINLPELVGCSLQKS
jgi:hypothetical protein